MSKLNEIIEANKLLVSLGGEDQLQNISAAAIERSLELQNRIDKALEYANALPANSMHAKKIASILDGVVAPEEEKVEVVKPKAKKPTPQKKKTSGAGSRQSGLSSRPRSERLAFRNWAREQGFTVPTAGPVPQDLVNAYDMAQAEMRRMQEEARKMREETPPDTV